MRRELLRDCAWLSVLSLLLYVPASSGVGLYMDDWPQLLRVSQGSPLGTYRPGEALYLELVFRLCGLTPWKLHAAQNLVWLATGCLLYLTLRRLGTPRLDSLGVTILFAYAPHCSTCHFMSNATIVVLAMGLWLGSVLCCDQAVSGSGWRRRTWSLAGVALVIASGLTYELFLPLVPLQALFFLARGGRNALWLALALLLALGALFWFKLQTSDRFAQGHSYLDLSSRSWLPSQLYFYLSVLKRAAVALFWQFGLACLTLFGNLGLALSVWQLGLGLLLSGAVLALLLRVPLEERPRLAEREVLVGLALFAAGFAIALVTYSLGVRISGMYDRISLAGSLGACLVYVGCFRLVGLAFPRRLRGAFLRGLIAVLSLVYALALLGLGGKWAESAALQARALQGIGSPPAGETVLVVGLEPNVGPAPVFPHNGWTLTAALRLTTGRTDLDGENLVSARDLALGNEGLSLRYPLEPDRPVPYARASAFDFRTGRLWKPTPAEWEQLRSSLPAAPPIVPTVMGVELY